MTASLVFRTRCYPRIAELWVFLPLCLTFTAVLRPMLKGRRKRECFSAASARSSNRHCRVILCPAFLAAIRPGLNVFRQCKRLPAIPAGPFYCGLLCAVFYCGGLFHHVAERLPCRSLSASIKQFFQPGKHGHTPLPQEQESQTNQPFPIFRALHELQ